MKQTICVIGCGWLGFPLSKSLINSGYTVKGSTTSFEKVALLNSNKIAGFQIVLTSESVSGDLQQCLEQCEVLVLNIPPGLRQNPESNYVQKINLLIPFIEKSSVNHVVFVSSTSVYDDDESFPVITETSPTTASENQLLTVERTLLKNSNFNTTIVRFSGLIGEDRHPATFLSGRKHIKNPDAPVNLIHQKDCIAILERIIELKIWNTTFNASTSPNPSKESYYVEECKSRDLALPEFDHSQPSKGKQIDSSKLAQVLDYTFKIKLS